jgi:plastocyanin/sugar lactone lactonase YvrE
MSRRFRRSLLLALLLSLVCFAMSGGSGVAQGETTVSVYASGLVNPKQMAFGPDGTLYVAESGKPGDVNVLLPANFGGSGPIGTNARVSKISPDGTRSDFVTGLPNIGLYGGVEMLGASGLTVLDGQLYELAAGHMTVSPQLSKVNDDGTLTHIADVGAFNNAHPPPGDNGDAVPMGNPYSLVNWNGDLYFTDGNYNRVTKSTTDGQLTLFEESTDDAPVTGAVVGPDGNLYVCEFSKAPYTAGTGKIDMITSDGKLHEGVVPNLTTPIAAAFDKDGTMYVLQYAAEFSAKELRYIPFGGEVLRVKADGTTEPVVTNLVFPTAMTFGPDGALYVTNYGNESNDGQGQVLRIVLGDTAATGPAVPTPDSSKAYAPPESGPATPVAAGSPIASAATIKIYDFGFDQPQITIQTGQSVTFINTGRIGHTATASEGSFDTGLLQQGQSATVTFNNPGKFAYYCQPHPFMKGVIQVEGPPRGSATAVAGAVTQTDTSPPMIGGLRILGFVVVLFGLIFGAGYAMRRRSGPEPTPTPPSPPPGNDDD